MTPFIIYAGIILALPFIFSHPKTTTVILLDNNSTHNGVIVTTEAGSASLDTPYTQTTLTAPDVKPEAAKSVDESELRKKYAQTLDALPALPVTLLFYFEEGSAQLTSESKAQTAVLVDLIKIREPCIVDIIGHTDTEGSAEANYNLALKRAQMVKSFLDEQKIEMKEVSVLSYGESDPLIPTGDGVAEPRNRRVDVTVR
jgi:OOP family OmpA-OmpF porin